MIYDDVSYPSHYCKGRLFEPIEVINDWQLDFDLGNVIKYISRAGRKDDKLKDLEKALFYLNHSIDNEKKKIKENKLTKDRAVNSVMYDAHNCGPIAIDTSHTALCYKEKYDK